MTVTLPFRLRIDHDKKVLRIGVTDEKGNVVSATMNVTEIAAFMAILSQCEQALVLSKVGQEHNLPIDPNIAFNPQPGGLLLTAWENVAKMTLGTDPHDGSILLQFLSRRGRLTGFHMSAEMALDLAEGLARTAANAPQPGKAN
jgi:hypothetical protein